MVTEIIYAYIENLVYIGIIGIIIIFGLFVFLSIARFTNDIDKDDWLYMLVWLTPTFMFFLFLTMLPGKAHIIEVREAFNQIDATYPKKSQNETQVLYPSDICNSVSECK